MQLKRTIFALIPVLLALPIAAPGSETGSATPLAHEDVVYRQVLSRLNDQPEIPALSTLDSTELSAGINIGNKHTALLLSKIYLAYGLDAEARQVLQQLSRTNLNRDELDLQWLELARLQFRQGSFSDTEKSLAQIIGPLRSSEEVKLLQANLRINRGGQLTDKQEDTQPEQNTPLWQNYADYNQAVALLKTGRNTEGLHLLDKIGSMNAASSESRALKDQANLVVAEHYLDHQQPSEALIYFQRIRISGPFSNQALLGMGWSYDKLGEYQLALTPWLELIKRDPHSPEVQEARLAAAQALTRLKANQQAQKQYQDAIDIYRRELKFVKTATGTAGKTSWLSGFTGGALISSEEILKNAVHDNPYLVSLLDNPQILSSIAKYQALSAMQETLLRSRSDIRIYLDFLTEKQRQYEDQLPSLLHSNYLASQNIQLSLESYDKELARIEKTRDSFALMTEQEQHQLSVFKLVSDNIDVLSKLFSVGELDDKLGVYRGIITWHIITQYDERFSKAKRVRDELQDSVSDLARHRKRLLAYKDNGLKEIQRFKARLDGLDRQLDTLLSATETALKEKERTLNNDVIKILAAHEARLTRYLHQAYLSIAQLYEVAYASQHDGRDQ